MTAEEQIRIAQNTPRPDKHERRRARIQAIVLAMSVVISLVFMIFAFASKQEASQLRQELHETQQALEQCKADH